MDGAQDLQLFPCAFGQVHTLKEEKEHRENQVQELETSLAELRSQSGEWDKGQGRPESRSGSKAIKVASIALGRRVGTRALE